MEEFRDKTDEQLVSLSLKDKEAFWILVKRYEEKLSRYIKRISLIKEDALEDLLQDIFVKVYLNLNAFDQEMKFSSWIYRIAHNETISFIRKNKKYNQDVSIDDKDLEIIATEFFIEENHFNEHLLEKLNEAIFELEDKYKDVIVLKFIEDKSYEEISDILRMPTNTVGTQINRAKVKLKQKLLNKGIEI